MSRIIYLSINNQDIPTGGCKVIYRQVEALAQLGFDAYVTWREGQPRPDWLEHNAPILDVSQPTSLLPTDHLVMSELAHEAFATFRTARCARYVLVMNHYYVFRGLQDHADFAAAGVPNVLALSGVIARFMERCFQIAHVPVLPAPNDTAFFRPAAKKRQVAFMPRKRAGDLRQILEIFRRRFPQHQGVRFVPIDKMDEAETARLLGESEIFLSLNHYEGLGMPPLEAMAAGCQVVGFTGGGGDDYATPQNGIWINETDQLGFAFAIAAALDRAQSDDPQRAAMIAAGHATAERYSLPRMRDALRDFWGETVAQREHELARLAG